VGANVAVTKDRVACYEKFSASFYDVGYCFEVYSTIYFNAEIEFALGAHAGQGSDFVERVWNKFLAAEAGIHAHNQDMVNEVEDFSESLDGRGGIKHYAGFASMRSDEVETAIEMDASLLMDGNPVGANFREFGNEEIGILDHEVAIEGDFELATKGANDRRPDSEIGDEVAVHDIEMEDGAATVDGLLGIGGKLREVGGKN
jgi:hypothetical protein